MRLLQLLCAPALLGSISFARTYTSRATGSSTVSYGKDGTAPSFTFDELHTLQKIFLDNFIAPKNQIQAKKINSTIFAEDVQGRVDVTRTFYGRELNTEYLFGLFANIGANPNSFTMLGYPTSYQITHFAASQNIASASTRFNFTFPLLGNATVPLQIDTWNAFNHQGQISMYDATFKWWQWTVDFMVGAAASAHNMTLPQTIAFATQELANSICTTAETHCSGVDMQYQNMSQCMDFLVNNTRFGEAYEMGRNTLLCRMVHQNMVPLRPSAHCPHIGMNGGGYCDDDKTYAQTVTEPYFTNYPFQYKCEKDAKGGS